MHYTFIHKASFTTWHNSGFHKKSLYILLFSLFLHSCNSLQKKPAPVFMLCWASHSILPWYTPYSASITKWCFPHTELLITPTNVLWMVFSFVSRLATQQFSSLWSMCGFSTGHWLQPAVCPLWRIQGNFGAVSQTPSELTSHWVSMWEMLKIAKKPHFYLLSWGPAELQGFDCTNLPAAAGTRCLFYPQQFLTISCEQVKIYALPAFLSFLSAAEQSIAWKCQEAILV